MIATDLSTTDVWIFAAIVVLFLLSILLAAAETALTRVSKAKAQALAETVSGKQLDTLFNAWLFTPSKPTTW